MVNHLPQGRGDEVAPLPADRDNNTLIDEKDGKGKINPNKNRTVRALAGAGGRQHHCPSASNQSHRLRPHFSADAAVIRQAALLLHCG